MRQAWIQQTPRSQRPDAAETGGTDHRVNWEGVADTPPGDMKKQNTKLGPRHCPLHQWKFARKEKRGEKKKEVLGEQRAASAELAVPLAAQWREKAPTLRAPAISAPPQLPGTPALGHRNKMQPHLILTSLMRTSPVLSVTRPGTSVYQSRVGTEETKRLEWH